MSKGFQIPGQVRRPGKKKELTLQVHPRGGIDIVVHEVPNETGIPAPMICATLVNKDRDILWQDNSMLQVYTNVMDDGIKQYILHMPHGEQPIPIGVSRMHVLVDAEYKQWTLHRIDTPFSTKGSYKSDLVSLSDSGFTAASPPSVSDPTNPCNPCNQTFLTNVIGPIESTSYTYFSGDTTTGWMALRYDIGNNLTTATGTVLVEKPINLLDFEALTYS